MKSPPARILCTEDDADTRELLVFELTHAGFEVVCVESAEQALELATMELFDLYLIDGWLPGVCGDDLCASIRKFDCRTPILFYSGAAYESDKERAHASGAQGYIVKPARGDELIAEITRLIAESNLANNLSSIVTSVGRDEERRERKPPYREPLAMFQAQKEHNGI